MGITGKYDFKGISKLNALGLKAMLATSPYTAWLLKGGTALDYALELFGNFFANRGLVVMNLGAIYVNGEFDQGAFDRAMDSGWSQIEQKGRPNISPKEGKAIDDAVRNAAENYIRFSPRRRP